MGRRRLGLRSLVDTALAAGAVSHAAVLAAQMLALSDEALVNKLTAFKAQMADEVSQKDQNMQMEEF